MKRQLLEPVEIALSQPSPGMWDTVMSTYRDIGTSAEEQYMLKAKSKFMLPVKLLTTLGYNCIAEEIEAALVILRARAWLALRKKLEEQTSDATVLSTLRSTFEERFRYDEQGVPRVWKPEDDLEAAFKKARDEASLSLRRLGLALTQPQTLALLPLFSTISPSEPALLPTLPVSETAIDVESDTTSFDPSTAFTLLTPTKLLSLETRFKKDADAAYVEAKRSMVSSVAQIPLWMYGVLVVLGWNEAMTVLFNPLYFALLLVLAASA